MNIALGILFIAGVIAFIFSMALIFDDSIEGDEKKARDSILKLSCIAASLAILLTTGWISRKADNLINDEVNAKIGIEEISDTTINDIDYILIKRQ